MKQVRAAFDRRGGFSLIELAFTLAIIGILGLLLWQFAPRLKSLPAIAHLTGSTLDRSEAALNGFILAKGRLPCPDTSVANSGAEDCSGSAVTGWLPVRTLGLSLSERVRYGVYRAPSVTPVLDADLAIISDRYKPLLPATLSAVEPVYLNGLDFCLGLRNLSGIVSGTVLTAGTLQIPIAYGLAVAGAGDADNVADGGGNKSLFDGLNTSAGRFELAGAARSALYDDDTRTVGSAELFTRLGCASRLAETNAAARNAYAAYDIDQVAALYLRFRTFQVKVSQLNNSMVATNQILAIADLANAVASAAHAATETFETFGAAAPTIVLSAAAIALAAYGVFDATSAIADAADDLVEANAQKSASLNFKTQTAADLVAAASRVGAIDQKGLLP